MLGLARIVVLLTIVYIYIGILLLILFGTEFNEHYAHNWPFKSIDVRTVLYALAVVPADSRH